MLQRSIIYIIIFIVVSMASCSRRPSYVISEKKMIDVLYDIQLAQAVFRSNNEFASDNRKDALVEGILKKHNITQAELDSSLVWYSDNIQVYLIINDSVASRLRASSDRMIALKNEQYTKVRDWSRYIIPPFYYLTESTPTMTFSIDSFKIKTIDLAHFNIMFDIQGVSHIQDVEAGIYYTYKDTLVKNIYSIRENKHYVLAKPQLADSLLKEISGYIHVNNKIKGLTSGILMYNISYTDSLVSNIDSTTFTTSNKDLIKSPNQQEAVPAKPVNDATPVELNRENIEKKESDDVPVISNDKVERSPIMRRNRK